ncbi:MAG: hypothetical protein U5M51_14805 [Emticicia sp.]|nr:hypothetical protein [Emticicia sp.]
MILFQIKAILGHSIIVKMLMKKDIPFVALAIELQCQLWNILIN